MAFEVSKSFKVTVELAFSFTLKRVYLFACMTSDARED